MVFRCAVAAFFSCAPSRFLNAVASLWINIKMLHHHEWRIFFTVRTLHLRVCQREENDTEENGAANYARSLPHMPYINILIYDRQ